MIAEPDDLSGPGLRAFFRIAKAWKLSEQEQMRLLGSNAHVLLRHWKFGDGPPLSPDELTRISYIAGIYNGLHILLPDSADEWVRKPNKVPTFRGGSALDRMMLGDITDLRAVRRYVDAQCEG